MPTFVCVDLPDAASNSGEETKPVTNGDFDGRIQQSTPAEVSISFPKYSSTAIPNTNTNETEEANSKKESNNETISNLTADNSSAVSISDNSTRNGSTSTSSKGDLSTTTTTATATVTVGRLDESSDDPHAIEKG